MSTFTDWNGPQGGNVRASDMTAFTKAYAEMTALLSQHLNETASSDNVHHVKDFVDQKLQELRAMIPDVSRFISQTEADRAYAKQSDIPDVSGFAEKTDLADYALKESLGAYLKKNDLKADAVITAIETRLREIESWVSNPAKVIPELATDKLAGLVNAINQVQFVDKVMSAKIGGSDDDGVYYVLGMLKDKAGQAFVKFVDDKPFTAAVTFAITPEWKGALSVLTDNDQLANLKFKLVSCTDRSGNKHAYLAIQAGDWMSKFASSDGYGLFGQLTFETSGINFVPVDSDGYMPYNGACVSICDCPAGKGLSFSSLGSPILKERIFKEPDNPYITAKDTTLLDQVGIITFWPHYDEETGIAVEVPDGYHACDGSPVLEDDDVSDEFRAKYDTYPLQDYAVIKTKRSLSIIGE